MNKFRIIKSYISQYTNPLELNTGDTVNLVEEEKEEKWKGWIWAESKTNSGWIPVQILEISADKKSGIVKEYFTAKELNAEEGDYIEKIKSLNGWTWSKNLRTGDEGWIPDEITVKQSHN